MNTARPLLLLALAGAGCAHAPQLPEVSWPPPPEKPRIRYVTSLSDEDDVDPSGWTRFKRAVLGGRPTVKLLQPMGLALSDDGERLYVADMALRRVVRIDLKRKGMEIFAPDLPAFGAPFNVALDAQENVYVADSAARSVSAFSREGRLLWSVSKDLERPAGLALDRQRQILYVADASRHGKDTHRVLAYDLAGTRLREVGGGRGSGDGQFHFPAYLALDRDGNLYVGDTMNFRIQVFDPGGQFLQAYGEHGDAPGTFQRIKGLAFDGFGNLYVADGGPSVVQMFNRKFEPLMFFGGEAPQLPFFDIPSCIAVDQARNRVYVCNERAARINVYDLINTTAEDSLAPAAPPGKG